MTEREAYSAILKLVRSRDGQRRFGSLAGMRVQYGTERKLVMSLDRTAPKPGSDWERIDLVFASGATWLECAADLVAKGFGPLPEVSQ